MKNKIYFLGSFPPPFGGVTVKNQLMYDMLSQSLSIAVSKRNTVAGKLAHIIKGVLFGKRLILALTTPKLFMLTTIIGAICPRKMQNSIVLVMGGSMADRLEKRPRLCNDFKRYHWMYVETLGMLKKLQDMGFQNVSQLPNCRKKCPKEIRIKKNTEKLRCVFFSLISKDKGADTVLAAAKQLPQVQFDFYGVLEPSFAAEFQQEIPTIPNAQYHGVFPVNGDNVYEKLNEYDLLLLPTRALTEGIPGVLVEAKIAAVPAIVSDICYNSEIVEHGISGIVLKENTTPALAAAIAALDTDREQLYRLKQGALRSAEKYYIENYLEEILKVLET